MTDDFSTPLLEDDDRLRMHRFVVATLVSAVIIAVSVSVLMHVADPEGGWGVAAGVGAMFGFWMCPLGGAIFGNGFHEIDVERRHAARPQAEHPVPIMVEATAAAV
ncbi:MAG: hypothetical protein RIB98_02730 [Acidimicrobiales bacterium]